MDAPADELRPITFERDYTEMAAGSVLVTFGRTKVLCTASIDEDVPRWMRGSGKGWVTAEYSMLPGSSPERVDREAAKGKQSGRTVEIQRLIGRSLRAACDMRKLGERQVVVDCDVLQADGGTRTASICGGYLALHDALTRTMQAGSIEEHPLHSFCAAISVGIVDGTPVLDLPYVEDSRGRGRHERGDARASGGSRCSSRSRARPRAGRSRAASWTRCSRWPSSGSTEIMALQAETGGRRRRRDAVTMRIVCASANPDKVAEIAAFLEGAVDLAPRPADVPDVVEDADTLEGNARLKAVAICDATGEPAVADDTGLFVDALGGAPGVWTRATPARARRTPRTAPSSSRRSTRLPIGRRRSARSCSCAGHRVPSWSSRGCVPGGSPRPCAAGRGFGYDPLFIPDEGDGRAFSEMTAEEKNAISHRGRAFAALLDALSG